MWRSEATLDDQFLLTKAQVSAAGAPRGPRRPRGAEDAGPILDAGSNQP